jgi:hypothetical protein
MYEWLRFVVPATIFNSCPTVDVVTCFEAYQTTVAKVKGSGSNGHPSHVELREVMYALCEDRGWWDWRKAKFGQTAFPKLPLSWRS